MNLELFLPLLPRPFWPVLTLHQPQHLKDRYWVPAGRSSKTGSSGGELRAVDTQAWPRAVIQCPWQYIVEELSDRRRTRILKVVQTQKAVILPFHHPTSSYLSQTSCCPSRDFLLFNDAFVFISANSVSQPNKERKLQAVKCCNWTLKAS